MAISFVNSVEDLVMNISLHFVLIGDSYVETGFQEEIALLYMVSYFSTSAI